MKDTKTRVYEKTCQIARGKVTTYKRLAEAAAVSNPRVVGNILHRNPDPPRIPCHRVVNREGRLASNFGFGGPAEQARLLKLEGVEVENGRVNLEIYLDRNL